MVQLQSTDGLQAPQESGVSCIYFAAQWCEPCKLAGPIFERVAAELGDVAKFIKLDVDRVPDLMRSHGVRGVPTVIVMRDGEEISRKAGAFSSAQLRALVSFAARS